MNKCNKTDITVLKHNCVTRYRFGFMEWNGMVSVSVYKRTVRNNYNILLLGINDFDFRRLKPFGGRYAKGDEQNSINSVFDIFVL